MSKITFGILHKSPVTASEETTLQVASDDEIEGLEKDPNLGIFRILNQQDGDKRLVWNRLRLNDIQEAERMFKSFIGQGLEAHRVGSDGKPGGKMDKFDALAEEVIFLPMTMVKAG